MLPPCDTGHSLQVPRVEKRQRKTCQEFKGNLDGQRKSSHGTHRVNEHNQTFPQGSLTRTEGLGRGREWSWTLET